MLFSIDPDTFHEPRLCNLTNGTAFYLNTTSPRKLDCSCATTWKADPDFAGDIVLAVFLVLSTTTVLASLVPVLFKLGESWRSNRGNFWHWIDDIFTLRLRQPDQDPETSARARPGHQRSSVVSDPSDSDLEKSVAPNDANINGRRAAAMPARAEVGNRFVLAIQDFLVPLCNAQIFAGIVWVIWALRRWKHLTYYHEQFAVNFWWLTLTSVWISRVDLIALSPVQDLRSRMQRMILLIDVALASVLQIMVAEREHNHWNPIVEGRCYLSRDGSGEDINQNIFWEIGTIVYGIALLFSFLPSRNKWEKWVSSPLSRAMSKAGLAVRDSVASMRGYHEQKEQEVLLKQLLAYTYGIIEITCLGSAWLACWCLVQFMSIWGTGNGSIVIETGAYLIFAASSMFYIIAMKLDNRTLEVGREDTLTLGPSVLILMTVGIFYTHYTR